MTEHTAIIGEPPMWAKTADRVEDDQDVGELSGVSAYYDVTETWVEWDRGRSDYWECMADLRGICIGGNIYLDRRACVDAFGVDAVQKMETAAGEAAEERLNA